MSRHDATTPYVGRHRSGVLSLVATNYRPRHAQGRTR
jgi:hypothetical protein